MLTSENNLAAEWELYLRDYIRAEHNFVNPGIRDIAINHSNEHTSG